MCELMEPRGDFDAWANGDTDERLIGRLQRTHRGRQDRGDICREEKGGAKMDSRRRTSVIALREKQNRNVAEAKRRVRH
jgi:hypothetical protein